MADQHEAPKEKRPERVFLHTLSGRVALLSLFSACAIAGIAVAAAMDLRKAVMADADAAARRLATVSAVVERGFVDDARRTLASASALRVQPSAECDAAMAGLQARDKRLLAVGLASPLGNVFCGAPAGQKTFADRSLKRAIASKSFAAGDYAFDAGADRPTIAFAQPVIENGEIKAVTFAIMDVRALSDDALKDVFPADTAYGIVDGRGVMLIRHPEPDRWAGKPLPETDLIAEMLSRKEGAARLMGEDGIDRIYAFRRLDGIAPPSMYAYVGVPSDAAEANMRAAAVREAAVALVLLIVAFWAALTLGDILIARRVRRLVTTMRHVVMGESGEKDELPKGMGEMDDLTQLFDLMATRLKEAYGHTEETIKARTLALEFNKGMSDLEAARLEALLASIGEGVVAADKEGKIIFINQEAIHAGYWTGNLVGKSVYDVLRLVDEKGEPVPLGDRPASIALSTGKKIITQSVPKPYYYQRNDKSVFPVKITANPVILNDEVIGVIAVLRDITDEVEFDRRKSEFISIASHQLRSPLAATKWLSDMLRKGDVGKLQPKQQEMADKLFDANERMVVLVNELLNVARIDSGATKLTPQPTDVGKLVEGVMTDTTPLLAQKKQTWAYDKKPLPTLNIDGMLIREVIANLISNASKYSPEGAKVTMFAEVKGDEVYIAVKDQGIGIPKADQNQMFRKFFRAENALKSAVQGTGLGLYFCKQVIDLSGGRLWFESEENKGTTFIITLPLKAPPPAAA
ncbi:MAG TPA: ATP-binding protein [Candidatus Binatia bacterium]|jgi:PAS domain S-box-containing protein|nr:ATP-binding protein [Candidatus Binatia bacterium]